ncbi:uncharacterized protein LOC135169123 [Diachasmimorpha longicaudata]|uniref:uncharacterized protein LOC135169123 n=1 Tax=Diachasmimorpha longicaudata TaxID=58733 RepID=UPI0030B8B825
MKLRTLIDSGANRSLISTEIGPHLRNYAVDVGEDVMLGSGESRPLEGCVAMRLISESHFSIILFRLTNALAFDCVLGMDALQQLGLNLECRKNYRDDPAHPFITLTAQPLTIWYPSDGPSPKPINLDRPPPCTLTSLAIIPEDQSASLREKFKSWIKPAPEVANVCPLLTMRIDTQGHPPIRSPTRRYAPQILKVAQEKTKKLLEQGIVAPSQSDWCSWPVLVRKPDDSYRLCIDYRPLNAVTKHLAVPMQSLEDLLDCAHGTVYASKIDVSQAFHHIPLDDESKEKTAFAIPGLPPLG